jgi:hypothetical protein
MTSDAIEEEEKIEIADSDPTNQQPDENFLSERDHIREMSSSTGYMYNLPEMDQMNETPSLDEFDDLSVDNGRPPLPPSRFDPEPTGMFKPIETSSPQKPNLQRSTSSETNGALRSSRIGSPNPNLAFPKSPSSDRPGSRQKSISRSASKDLLNTENIEPVQIIEETSFADPVLVQLPGKVKRKCDHFCSFSRLVPDSANLDCVTKIFEQLRESTSKSEFLQIFSNHVTELPKLCRNEATMSKMVLREFLVKWPNATNLDKIFYGVLSPENIQEFIKTATTGCSICKLPPYHI